MAGEIIGAINENQYNRRRNPANGNGGGVIWRRQWRKRRRQSSIAGENRKHQWRKWRNGVTASNGGGVMAASIRHGVNENGKRAGVAKAAAALCARAARRQQRSSGVKYRNNQAAKMAAPSGSHLANGSGIGESAIMAAKQSAATRRSWRMA